MEVMKGAVQNPAMVSYAPLMECAFLWAECAMVSRTAWIHRMNLDAQLSHRPFLPLADLMNSLVMMELVSQIEGFVMDSRIAQ